IVWANMIHRAWRWVMRFDLSDEDWALLEPLLPKSRKSARVDDRKIMNAIFYVLRTGMPWRDLPARYGPYTTAYNRFNRWSRRGIWKRIFDRGIAVRQGLRALRTEIPIVLAMTDKLSPRMIHMIEDLCTDWRHLDGPLHAHERSQTMDARLSGGSR